MFERYTEKARRVIFFARYEASQYGSPSIETEHLLLGLLREDKALTNRFIRSHVSVETLRKEIEERTPRRGSTSTPVDLPLANPAKRALYYAAEEAESAAQPHIGTEHLLLGLLRESDTLAAQLLSEHGLRPYPIRSELNRQAHESAANIPANSPVLTGNVRAHRGPDPINLRRKVHLLRSIRIWLTVVIVGLVLSGVTAFPLQHETALLVRIAAGLHLSDRAPALNAWFVRVAAALADTDARYPFLAYGTDWLAFAHLVIAAAFLGPWRDPVRNQWVVTWGLIACASVPLLALIAEPIRGIPLFWSLIDCSFGVFCALFLLWVRRQIQQLAAVSRTP